MKTTDCQSAASLVEQLENLKVKMTDYLLAGKKAKKKAELMVRVMAYQLVVNLVGKTALMMARMTAC